MPADLVPPTPALVVKVDILERNLARMAELARREGVRLRPHAKAHKCVEVARRQIELGACGLTVAKLSEAEVMLRAGIRDIFIAYQIVGEDKIERLASMSRQARLTTAVDSLQGVEALDRAGRAAGVVFPVMVEVDSGLRRCGTLPGEPTLNLARQICRLQNLELRGLFTHAGHAYAASSSDEVTRIAREEVAAVTSTADLLRRDGIPVGEVSVGSTPTAWADADRTGITELRPGNYVFHDATQQALGSAGFSDCALRIVTTIISRPAHNRLVIDAGAKTLALDRGAHGTSLLKGFGLIPGHPEITIARLSEEHGILEVPDSCPLEVGARLEIIPNHACTAINLAEHLYVLKGDRIVARWDVAARAKVT